MIEIKSENLRVDQEFQQTKSGGLFEYLNKKGRMPPVNFIIRPIDPNKKQINFGRFLSYSFKSSVIVPVDTFQFTVAIPDDEESFNEQVKPGDLVALFANDIQLTTGIIDTVEITLDADNGESITVTGRDLMGQLEDQDAINIRTGPLYGQDEPIETSLRKLISDTRIKTNFSFRTTSGKFKQLFATSPGETKLNALQRLLEPINALAWMLPDGTMAVGKPDMAQDSSGKIYAIRSESTSNVLAISVNRSPTQIPTSVLPVYSGQETVQNRVSPESVIYNNAVDVKRLSRLGHFNPKCVVVSLPNASGPQDLPDINFIRNQAGAANLLQAHAKRLIARENYRELVVQAVMLGHYNENGEPYQVDQVYDVIFERGGVNEKMYVFDLEYTFGQKGEQTTLNLCRLGTLVADIPAPKASSLLRSQ